jgi:predicted ABC-type transport system involved in lysophospholipase L1 biosynthesis ATPase subunit
MRARSSRCVRVEVQPVEGVGEAQPADLRLAAIGFVFQQFNLIPHDQWVADRADRVLKLDSGRLVGDATAGPARVTAR